MFRKYFLLNTQEKRLHCHECRRPVKYITLKSPNPEFSYMPFTRTIVLIDALCRYCAVI